MDNTLLSQPSAPGAYSGWSAAHAPLQCVQAVQGVRLPPPPPPPPRAAALWHTAPSPPHYDVFSATACAAAPTAACAPCVSSTRELRELRESALAPATAHGAGAQRVQGLQRVCCTQCGLLFGDANSLRRHAARAHRKADSGVVVCQQCHIAVRNEQNLKRHVAVCHSGEQSICCKTCSARFCSMTSLRIHQQNVHQVRKRVVKQRLHKSFVCQTCGDCFKWKGNLKRHMQLMHLGIRPWACGVCDAKFGTKSNMRVHLMTHAKDARR